MNHFHSDTVVMEKDPVCGMDVGPDNTLENSYEGETFHFCSEHCLNKFRDHPAAYTGNHSAAEEYREKTGNDETGEYTCPMHPEVVSDKPDSCPKCGMALEPRSVPSEKEENPELHDMSLRCGIRTWISPDRYCGAGY